jgi:hypothetical protein
MPASTRATTSLFGQASHAVSRFRWIFMPLGLFALLAIGIHAAADVLDDHILRVVERADVWLDGLFASWSVTLPLVDAIGQGERRLVARGLTLLCELVADLVLAVPALSYYEQDASEARASAASGQTWRALARRLLREPNPVRFLRPAMTAAVALAGACAVGKRVEAALRLGILENDVGQALVRLVALVALFMIVSLFGWRAILQSLEHSDRLVSRAFAKRSWLGRLVAGWAGTLIAAPLALEAILEASPLMSFFR